VSRPTARDAFDLNFDDAQRLVDLAGSLANQRVRRMRAEKRGSVGSALRIPRKHHATLDCIESDDFFGVFLPGSKLDREFFTEQGLRPLLRQSVVAACAALETFVADRVMERFLPALRGDDPPARLLALTMTIAEWQDISAYQRPSYALRRVFESKIREEHASASPSQIAKAFSIVGEKDLWKRVDGRRKVARGISAETLERIVERRNLIAHTGDRKGHGRAAISIDEVRGDLNCVRSIVDALDALTRDE
jgi:hypothetical protein